MTALKLPKINLIVYSVIFIIIHHISFAQSLKKVQSQDFAVKSDVQLNLTTAPNVNQLNKTLNIPSISADIIIKNPKISKEDLDKFRDDLRKLKFALMVSQNLTENLDKKVDSQSTTTQTPLEETKPPETSRISTESSMFSVVNLFSYLNPVSYFLSPQTIRDNLQNSFKALTIATQELIPIAYQLSQSSKGLPQSIAGDIPSSAVKLSSIITNDLPKIATSLPNSMTELANAIFKLNTNATKMPAIARNATSETLRSLPSEVIKMAKAISFLQTLVSETIPKTSYIAGLAATNAASNLTQISQSINLLTNAAQHLPKTVERVQSTINSFNRLVQNFPEGQKLPEEVAEQLKISFSKLTATIKALPANLKSITNVATNLQNTIRRTPTAIQKSIGVLPFFGNKDPAEALERIRLRERFESKVKDETDDEVAIGKSILSSFNSLNGTKDGVGIEKLAQNLVISMRKVVGLVQGSKDSTILTPVRPLVDSVKSLLDIMQNMGTTNNIIPDRATLDPLLGLVNTFTDKI